MYNIFKSRLDFDEITFENRNKEYGAYQIRKGYNLSLIFSLILGSIIVSSIVIYPFLKTISQRHDMTRQREIRFVEVKMDKMEPPKEIYIPPPPPPPPPATIPNIKYVAPVIVDTLPANTKAIPSVAEVLASDPSNVQLPVTGTGSNNELTGQIGEESEEPFMVVEVPPTFKGGGLEEFRNWVQKRTVYPTVAQDIGIQGTVYLTFIVERDGTVTNVKVIKGVDKLLDDEAVKGIEGSPKWSPGLQRGRPVRVRFQLPLVFKFTR